MGFDGVTPEERREWAKRSIQSRLIDIKAALAKALESGNLTVSSARRYDGQPCGPLIWAAALQMVQNGKAVRLSFRRRRIARGPRPHVKFIEEMVISKPSPDAI